MKKNIELKKGFVFSCEEICIHNENSFTIREDNSTPITKESFEKCVELINNQIKEGNVNGSHIMALLFPKVSKIDCFLSHSHSDIEFVRTIKQLLEEQGKKCFIDADMWGNINDIENLISENGDINYNYNLHNLHSMLSLSLLHTISQSKNFIFLQTENTNHNEYSVKSNWIYEELNYAEYLLQKPVCYWEKINDISQFKELLEQ